MSCKVRLNNSGVYLPGDSIKGTVVCTFHDQQYVKAIKCFLQGKESTNWNERSENGVVNYTSFHIFLEDTLFLGLGNRVIDPGVYEFPFSFNLPTSDIPSSYFHIYGSIQYIVSAKIFVPQSNVVEDEMEINVNVPVIFDGRSLFPVANQTEDENFFCCFPVAPTILSLAIQKDTFFPGEMMKIRVELDNKYDVDATAISVQLLAIFQFYAKCPTPGYKYIQNEIAKASDVGVTVGSQKICEFNLRIPSTIVIPNFDGCTLFKHWYSLNAEALFRSDGVLKPNKLNTNIYSIDLCHKSLSSSQLAFQSNLPAIGFSQNVVPVSEIISAPPVVPVAQAPPGSYPPIKNDPPYPIADPPLMPSRDNSYLNRYEPLAYPPPPKTVLREYPPQRPFTSPDYPSDPPISAPLISTDYPLPTPTTVAPYPPPPRLISTDITFSDRSTTPGYPCTQRDSNFNDYPTNNFTASSYSSRQSNPTPPSITSSTRYSRVTEQANQNIGIIRPSTRTRRTLDNVMTVSRKSESPPPSYDDILRQPLSRPSEDDL